MSRLSAHLRFHFPARYLAALALCTLAACGGGGDDEAADPAPGNNGGGSSNGGTLTLSSSAPASHNGALNTTPATFTNEARAADLASATPYCAVTAADAVHANGGKYRVQVYFRQSDAKVLNASVYVDTFAWGANATDFVAGVDAVSVNPTTRTITFTARALVNPGDAGQSSTVNGSFTFPKHATVAACGA